MTLDVLNYFETRNNCLQQLSLNESSKALTHLDMVLHSASGGGRAKGFFYGDLIFLDGL